MAQMQSTGLSVKTIDHVTLVVKDLERSRRFYRDVLGMAETERPGFGFPGLWFQAGETQVHMNVEGPEAGPAGMADFQGTMPSRGFHFAFEVDDCDAAAAQLRQMGIEIVAGPRHRPRAGPPAGPCGPCRGDGKRCRS